MKKQFRILSIFIALALVISVNVSIAQPPPPPPPPGGGGNNGHGQGGNQGAPVGDGMFMLIGLAGLYGGKKVYDYRKALKSE